jgi:AraC-like DNA-binding protein
MALDFIYFLIMKLTRGKYFGHTLDAYSVAGLVLTEKVHDINEKCPDHFHENPYFCIGLAGGWKEVVEGKSYQCTTDTLVFHPKEEVHRTYFAPSIPTKTFNIEITPEWTSQMDRYNLEPLKNRFFSNDHSLTPYLYRIYNEFRKDDAFSKMAIEGIFIEMSVSLLRTSIKEIKKPNHLWLEEVKTRLSQTFLQPYSLLQLATEFSVHPVYLSKAFKKGFGVTITDYYRKCKIDFACALLRDTELSLVEVALEAGFYDQSHFSKNFHLLMNITPLTYRKLFR